MVRTTLINKNHEIYLQKCALESKFSFGLIIGQPSKPDTDYIVHLAKNVDIGDHEIFSTESIQETGPMVKSIADITNPILANHVVSVTKMIPGSFYVLGLFIVDDHNIFDNKDEVKISINLLQEINTVLKSNKYLRGFSTELQNGEKILISYAMKQKTCVSKTYNPHDGKGIFMPNKVTILESPIGWHMFETNYDLDNVFPIVEKNKKINIEHHFGITLEKIIEYLENSEVFVQNQPIDNDQILENFIKEKFVDNNQDTLFSFKVCLFLPAVASAKDPIVVEKFQGMIRFSGVIASRVWTHSNNRLEDIAIFIRNDIIRSLSSRIQSYCDGLIDQFASSDAIVISEPPRRVFFNLPGSGGVQFCEYIFRGETPSVAAAQAKDLLDLIIDPDTIDADLEGLPVDEESLSLNGIASEKLIKSKNGHRLYMFGLIIAIFVLICSIALHFILE